MSKLSELKELEKNLEARIKELEMKLAHLDEIKYKYYCLGSIYFVIIIIFSFIVPVFDFLLLITFIYFSVIFFGELILRLLKTIFKAIFKSKKD
jgi:hypothetical protein